MDGGEQLGRRLSYLGSDATEEEEEEEEVTNPSSQGHLSMLRYCKYAPGVLHIRRTIRL
jgi:hypothetical protein